MLTFYLCEVSNKHALRMPEFMFFTLWTGLVFPLISPLGALVPFTKDQDPPFSLYQTASPVTPCCEQLGTGLLPPRCLGYSSALLPGTLSALEHATALD